MYYHVYYVEYNLRLIFDYIDILSILVIIINNKNVIFSLIDLHYQLIQTNIDNIYR
jgi:hypothetical protein